MYLRRCPSGPLRSYVDSLWYAERDALPHTRERCLPTGCADIVVPLLQDHVIRYDSVDDTHARRLRGAIVQGPFDRFGVRGIEGASAVVGVHFTPGGAAAFLGGALPALRNRTEELEDLWGSSARELRERLQAATCSSWTRICYIGFVMPRRPILWPPSRLRRSAATQPAHAWSRCSARAAIRRANSSIASNRRWV